MNGGGHPPRALAPQTANQRAHPALAAHRGQPLHRAARAFAALLLSTTALLLAAYGMPSFAEETREVHGSGDAYAAPGVTLAWAVLRGADEASTQVVLRIEADPKVYATVSVIGKNPFGGQERVLLAPTAANANIDVRVSRAQYADFPRTELRLYAPGSITTPAVVVYYLGVPDTTPEFPDATKLDPYLADRIARARAARGNRP